MAEMGSGNATAPRIALAVNADSMATWFAGVFAVLDGVLVDVRIEDQDHSARLLREGVVMGAVTTERTPVSGCRVLELGVMRYVPVASRTYIDRHLPDGFTAHAVAAAPSLAWNRDDALQDLLVRRCSAGISRGRSISCRRRRASAPRCETAWGGACPRKSGRAAYRRRVVRARYGLSSGRAIVLAVLETRQPTGSSRDRRGAVIGRGPAPGTTLGDVAALSDMGQGDAQPPPAAGHPRHDGSVWDVQHRGDLRTAVSLDVRSSREPPGILPAARPVPP